MAAARARAAAELPGGQVASTLGGSTSGIVLPLLVLAMTGSASVAQIGLVFSASAGGLAGALQRLRLTRPRLTRRQLASA